MKRLFLGKNFMKILWIEKKTYVGKRKIYHHYYHPDECLRVYVARSCSCESQNILGLSVVTLVIQSFVFPSIDIKMIGISTV